MGRYGKLYSLEQLENKIIGNVDLVDFSFKEIDSANETNTDSDLSVASYSQPA